MAGGLARLFLVAHPHERYAVIVTLLWTVFNTIVLLASLGVIFEHRQRRSSGRLPADFTAQIGQEQNLLNGSIHDLSEGGASLLLDDDATMNYRRGNHFKGRSPRSGKAFRVQCAHPQSASGRPEGLGRP